MRINESKLNKIVKDSIRNVLYEASVSGKNTVVSMQLGLLAGQNNVQEFEKLFSSLDRTTQIEIYNYFVGDNRLKMPNAQTFIDIMENCVQ